jgi:integrase
MTVHFDQERDTWLFALWHRDAEGKRRQIKRRGFSTQQEAQAAQDEMQARTEALRLRADGTVRGELEAWLATRSAYMQPNGLDTYKRYLRGYVIAHIGDRRVLDLSARDLETLYGVLRVSGARGGKPLSPVTVANVHRTLKSVLKQCGITIDVKEPATPRNRKGRKGTWSPAQALRYLDSVRDSRQHPMWLLFIVFGLRRGEVAGLRWSSVDLDAGTIRIDSQRTTADHQVIEVEPKGYSARTLPCPTPVLAALKAQRAQADMEGNESAYVFTSRRGDAYCPTHLSAHFQVLSRRGGLPAIALHDLRHSALSTLAAMRVDPETIRRVAGHSDFRTTLAYIHADQGAQALALSEVADRLK